MIVDPNDTWVNPQTKRKELRDVPRSLRFVAGQFIAKEQWQVDILRNQPHVREADFDEDMDPCDICGYRTRSLRDFQEHTRKHL